jgi:kinesin family protein 3/17
MIGEPDVPDLRGVIPNSFQHIFEAITSAEEDKTFLVSCSYSEIYNEEFRDLLNPKNPNKLELRETEDGTINVPNLTRTVVKSVTDIDRLMEYGSK